MTKMPDYLESQGNDYILIPDFYPSSTVRRVEYKLTINESNTTKAYFGARTSNGNSAIILWQVSGKFRYDWGNSNTSGATIVSGTTYESEMTANSTTFTSNSPLAVFAVNSNNVIDGRMGKARIYYIRMYDSSDNLLLDLIPWISENKACIRDRVSGSIYFSSNGLITYGYD